MNVYKPMPDVSFGVPVTQRVKRVKQPRGGYMKARDMTITRLGEGTEALHPEENINAGLIGLAVDYLTRFAAGTAVEEAFAVSLKGAANIKASKIARRLLASVKGLDDVSIVHAVKLCGFDVCYRVGPSGYQPVEEIRPDQRTIANIRTMVERTLHFFEIFGPVVLDGFDFDGAYTGKVSHGDGDFITTDTLWDLKTSKRGINKNQTLQLLMYWRMGLRTAQPEFRRVEYLGIFNPRKNEAARMAVVDIPQSVIHIVDTEVIGYGEGE